jgi:hypothetical protein
MVSDILVSPMFAFCRMFLSSAVNPPAIAAVTTNRKLRVIAVFVKAVVSSNLVQQLKTNDAGTPV